MMPPSDPEDASRHAEEGSFEEAAPSGAASPPGPRMNALKTAERLLGQGFWPIVLYAPGEEREVDGEIVPAKGKEPVGRGWGLRRPRVSDLRRRFTEFPGRGVGLKLGPSGGAIDCEVDGPEGEDSLRRLCGGTIPETLGWTSRRGPHRLFAWDPRLEAVGRIKVTLDGFPGLEIRCGQDDKQSQSACPPTVGEDGVPRRWNGVAYLAELPDCAVQAILEAEARAAQPKAQPKPSRNGHIVSSEKLAAYARKAFDDEVNAVAGAVPDTRNNTLNVAAFNLGTLIGAGALERDEVEAALEDAAARAGLGRGETRRTIRSGIDAGKAQPRDLSDVGAKRKPHGHSPECPECPVPSQGEGWKPLNWTELPADPGAPLEVLPAPLVELCKAVASAYGVDLGVPMVMILALAAGLIGKAYAFSPVPGWSEYASLSMALVMPSSGGKSPARRLLMGPVHDVEEGLHQSQGRLLVSDITIEAFARLMRANPRGLLATYDELTALLMGMGQYKHGKGNDMPKLNAIWSHETFTVDRVEDQKAGKEPIRVSDPCLTIFGCMTPDKLSLLGQRDTDGSLERWLCCVPPVLPARPIKMRGSVDPEVAAPWRQIVMRLAEMGRDPAGAVATTQISLSPEGLDAWDKWDTEHCAEINSPTFDDALRPAWRKMDAQAGRMASVLECLRAAHRRAELPSAMVGPKIANDAWKLVKYFKVHHLRAIATRGLILPHGAKLITTWILNHPEDVAPGKSFSRSHITKCYPSRDYDPFLVDEGLDWLKLRNALREVQDIQDIQGNRRTRRPGRKPSPDYEVHPDLIPMLQAKASRDAEVEEEGD